MLFTSRLTAVICIPLLVTLTSSCIVRKSTERRAASSPTCLPTTTKPNANLAVVGGQVEAGQPQVVMLVKVTGNNLGLCTGTFVGSNVIVTAGHCIDNSTTGGMTVIPGLTTLDMDNELRTNGATLRSKGIVPIKAINSGYTKENLVGKNGEVLNPQNIAYDLAFLIMPPNTAPAIATITNGALTTKTQAMIVGFGKTTHNEQIIESVATKRQGQLLVAPSQQIAGILEGYSSEPGVAQILASSAEGDSGGPIFLGSEIIGTVSSGAVDRNNNAISTFVDLTSAKSKELIQKATAAGAVFGQTSTPSSQPPPATNANAPATCT